MSPGLAQSEKSIQKVSTAQTINPNSLKTFMLYQLVALPILIKTNILVTYAVDQSWSMTSGDTDYEPPISEEGLQDPKFNRPQSSA